MKRLTADLRTHLLPIGLSQLVGFLCGVAGVKLNSWLIAPDDFGRYGVFLTLTPLGMWVVHAGLVKLTQRHWAGATDRPAWWRQLLRIAVGRMPWLVLAAAAASLLVAGGDWMGTFPFVLVAATALSFGTLGQVALQADRRHWADLGVSAGGSLTRTFVPPLLYFALGGSVGALYAGFGLHALVFAALALGCARPREPGPARAPAPLALPTTFTGPMFNLLAIASWTLMGLNRWLVALFFGATPAGYFTLASNLALIAPAMLGTMLTQYYQPQIFAAPRETPADLTQLARQVDRVALGFWLLALAATGILRLVLPPLVGILIDDKYLPSLAYVLPAGCFFTAVVTTQFYQQLVLAARRESILGPVEFTFAAILILGGLAAATGGESLFQTWLLASALAPWVITRPLVRSRLLAASAP